MGPNAQLGLIGIGGFPHSEIVGSKVAHTSPTLIAACHVLHRLYAPRHPRIALTLRLRVRTTNDNAGLTSEEANQNSAEQQCHSILVRMIKMLSLITFSTDPIDHPEANLSAIFQIATVTASILRTHSQCQTGSHAPIISA